MLYLKSDHIPLSAVIFDLGNVMLDFAPARFMGELGIAPKYHQRLLEIFPRSAEWQQLDNGDITDEELLASALRKEPSLRREILLFHKHWHEHFHAIPQNVAAFYRIKEAGVKTCILSNFQKSCFEYESRHNIFLNDFDVRVLSYECHLCKPNADIYEYLIKIGELDPAHSIFFDDVEANITAARAAGLLGVQLPIGGDIADYLEFPEN